MTQHILLYTDDPGIGGVAQYNHTILLGLAKRGYRVTSVQGFSSNPLIDQQKQQGIHHEWLPFDTFKDFSRTVSNPNDALNIFQSLQPDLILFSDACPISNYAAKQVAIQLDIPFVVVIGFVASSPREHFGASIDPSGYLDRLAQQFQHAHQVIAVSQDNLNLLHQQFRLPPDKGIVIHYGRPDRYFQPPNPIVRDRLRREVGIPADGICCFTAARLEPIKGFEYLLDAILNLRQTPLWDILHFVWAGDGTLRDWLSETLDEEGLADHVHLLGQRWDIDQWLDAADIFILPSEVEGMPLSIMEAMAKGVPVVASAVSGIPEELGETGKLLPNPRRDPRDTVDTLIATLMEWGTNANLCRNIGQAGRKRAQSMFRQSRMVEQTLAIIESALRISQSSQSPNPLPQPRQSPNAHPVAQTTAPSFPAGDYISPGFAIIQPDRAFPSLAILDPSDRTWANLRRDVPHNCYIDAEWPGEGGLTRDEAHILYNTALQFAGQRSLQIGCWNGWTAAHLALAEVRLDVISSRLDDSEFQAAVRHSLGVLGVSDRVNWVADPHPHRLEELANRGDRWSFIFIDGNHTAPAPLQDAIACEPFAAPDALILFHHLASPDVAQGLDYLRQRGWNTAIYQTQQIMGVAWRGQVSPIPHLPDPTVQWRLPAHLAYYPMSPQPSPDNPSASTPAVETDSPAAGHSSPNSPPPVVQQAHALMQEAVNLFNQGQPVAAMHRAEEAASLGVFIPEMHYLRSVCLCAVGRHREGLEAAKAELEMNPGHAKAQQQVEQLTGALFASNVEDIPMSDRPWGSELPHDTLLSIQRATFNYAYRGVPMIKNPFDLAIYPMLIWDLKPRTIIEIGSKDGGSALWLGDMLNNFGIDGHIYSLDIVKVTGLFHPRVTFIEGDGRALANSFSPDFLAQLPRPWLVIDDADHAYETSLHVLEFFHPYLNADEYIVVEDGIISDMFQDQNYNSGPHKALKEFLAAYGDAYTIDANYCDFFGYNLTWNTNGYLKKLKDTPQPSVQPKPVAQPEPTTALLNQLFQAIAQTKGSQSPELQAWQQRGKAAIASGNLSEALQAALHLLSSPDAGGPTVGDRTVSNAALSDPEASEHQTSVNPKSDEPEFGESVASESDRVDANNASPAIPHVSQPNTPPSAEPEADLWDYEPLNSAGILSYEQLTSLVAQFQQDSDASLAIGQLRRVRLHLGDYWLGLLMDELEEAYSSPIGETQQWLIECGLRGESLTAAERSFKHETVSYLKEGMAIPGAVPHLLAAMLYSFPHQLPIPVSLDHIPEWLVADFIHYLFTPPLGFANQTELDQFCQHLNQWTTYIHTRCLADSDSPLWQQVAIAFAQSADFSPLQYSAQPWAALYQKRGELLEFAFTAQGYAIEQPDELRSPQPGVIRIGIVGALPSRDWDVSQKLAAVAALNPTQFQVIGFSFADAPDLLLNLPSSIPTTELSIDLAEQVQTLRAAQLDVLLIADELTGATTPAVQIALHRIAPLQIGLCGTSRGGLSRVDRLWVSASPAAVLEQTTDEPLLVIEPAEWTDSKRSPTSPIDRTTLGVPAWASTLFGADLDFTALTAERMQQWIAILKAVPNSVLMLRSTSIPSYRYRQQMTVLHATLADHAIAENRLLLLPHNPLTHDYSTIEWADVYLAPIPLADLRGVLAALQAQVPPVVCLNDSLSGRQIMELLDQFGLEPLIETEADYIARAIALGSDPSLRQSVSQQLASTTPVRTSPETVTEQLEQALIASLDRPAAPITPVVATQSVNLVAFPDWTQPENILFQDLTELLRGVLLHPHREQISLWVYVESIGEEDADLALSSVLMQLLEEDEIAINHPEPTISLISNLDAAQWRSFASDLSTRLALEHENEAAIARLGADQLPSCAVWHLSDR